MRPPRGHGPVISDTGWPDAAVAEAAARQRTLVTRGQLLVLGIRPRTVDRAVSRGRLFRVHAGVYSLVPANVRPPWAAELAAVLAYGDRTVLSHETAARLHGIEVSDLPGAIHVTLIGRQNKRSHTAVTLHRTATMHPQEHFRLQGLPVTSVARTVIDLAPSQTPRGRELLIDAALRKTSRTKLQEALARHPRRPGTPALRGLLDPLRPSSLSWSQQEERLRRLLMKAGLPGPESNVELYAGYFPDLLWREQRVIVEYQSDQWHSGRGAHAYDTTRQNRLTADGYTVIPVTYEQLSERPEEVLVWIAQALARRG